MQASPLCIEFIRKKEGFFQRAYRCPAGVWTIGYGTIRWDLKTPVKPGETITREEAERQLAIEVQRVADAVTEAVTVELTQNEFDALVSFGYNVGIGWITGKGHAQATMIKLLNKGKYDVVPGQLLLFSRTIGGKSLPGLLTRRKEEAQMWLAQDHAPVVAAAQETVLPDALPENGTIPEAMPQAVKPAKAETAITTATASQSARWSLAGIAAAGGTWFDSLFGWSKQTAQQVLDAEGDTNGIQTLIGKFTHHAESIGLAFITVALIVVLVRKFMAAAEGRSF
jgi:lysozyme